MAELRTLTITENVRVNDVLTDLDAPPTFTSLAGDEDGVIRNQDSVVVVAAGTALTKISTGVYSHSFTESPNNYTYNYWIKWILNGDTHYDEHTLLGGSSAITTREKFKDYVGITTTDDDALIDALILRATSAIEQYCDRIFTFDSYRERHDGTGDRELTVDQYPIGQITLLSLGTNDVVSVQNANSDAYNAFIRVTDTTITFTVKGGTNDGSESITLTDHTLTSLVAAINALTTGWSAILQISDYGVWNAEELLNVSGLECLDSLAFLPAPDEPVDQLITYDDRGVITLPRVFPRGRQNIIVNYTAGFSTMPPDLEQITIDLTNIYYMSRKSDPSIASERLGDHAINYTTGKNSSESGRLPDDIKMRLGPYKKWRLA